MRKSKVIDVWGIRHNPPTHNIPTEFILMNTVEVSGTFERDKATRVSIRRGLFVFAEEAASRGYPKGASTENFDD